MSELRFRSAAELWPKVDRAFQRESRTICLLLPEAEVEHIGATAVPGSLTKGDLDLLVRVPADRFAETATTLGTHYSIHQPDAWTGSYAVFVAADAHDPPVGVRLVVAGSETDRAFITLRRLLRTRPDVLERTNGLKRTYEGGAADAYALAKNALFEELLADEIAEATPPRPA